jgi:hypothetical protein
MGSWVKPKRENRNIGNHFQLFKKLWIEIEILKISLTQFYLPWQSLSNLLNANYEFKILLKGMDFNYTTPIIQLHANENFLLTNSLNNIWKWMIGICEQYFYIVKAFYYVMLLGCYYNKLV